MVRLNIKESKVVVVYEVDVEECHQRVGNNTHKKDQQFLVNTHKLKVMVSLKHLVEATKGYAKHNDFYYVESTHYS